MLTVLVDSWADGSNDVHLQWRNQNLVEFGGRVPESDARSVTRSMGKQEKRHPSESLKVRVHVPVSPPLAPWAPSTEPSFTTPPHPHAQRLSDNASL